MSSFKAVSTLYRATTRCFVGTERFAVVQRADGVWFGGG